MLTTREARKDKKQKAKSASRILQASANAFSKMAKGKSPIIKKQVDDEG